MSRKTIIQLWLCLLCLFPKHAASQTLEYWFDNHYDLRGTTSIATSNAEQELSLDLRDNTLFPYGFHKLNMRVIIAGKPSSIYSSNVLKLAAGKASHLEYWVDDEMSKGNIKTIDGVISEDGITYNFLESLNLADVSPGYHKLYYRAVSNSRRTTSAIGSTPILVKSKYNVENPEVLTVTKQAYWFDDEEPKVEYVAPSRNVVNWDYKLDTRSLSDGQHTLHLQYSNSAGIWNGPINTTFTKTKVEVPKITANSSIEDGVLTLNFNTVPYGYVYSIIRQYPSGNIRKVKDIQSTEYPAALKFTDTPAPGNYIYYVEGRYLDVDGQVQRVRSEDVSITVDKAAESLKRGCVNGALKINGEKITWEWFTGSYTVYINGERARNTNYSYSEGTKGTFKIENIPYGTELSIGVGYHDEDLSSKLITIVVDENTSNSTYYFDCNEEGEESFIPTTDAYDLIAEDDIHITPNTWEIELKNKSLYRAWSGDITVKVISKEALEMYEKQSRGELSSLYFFLNPNAVYYEPSAITSAKTHVKFEKHEDKVVTLNIIDLPKRNKNEDYYVSVYSQKDGEETMKPVAYTPQTISFNPYDVDVAIMNGFKSYMKGYADAMKLFKEFAAWGDPLKLAWESVTEKEFELVCKNYEKGDVDVEELLEDQVNVAIKSSGMLLNCFFEDMHKAIKKYTDSFKNTSAYKISDNLSKLYNAINGTIDASRADDSGQFFKLAKQVLKTAKSLKITDDPLISLYTTYFECGLSMAEAVEGLANFNKNKYVWERLVTGKGVYKIKVRKYTTDNKGIRYFTGEEIYSQIESIKITLSPPAQSGMEVESMSYETNFDDGLTIKNVEFGGANNTYYDKTEAWMTIVWKNKRVTHIPLLDKNFVKLQNFRQTSNDPLTMTVELQSETYMDIKSIANKLSFIEP